MLKDNNRSRCSWNGKFSLSFEWKIHKSVYCYPGPRGFSWFSLFEKRRTRVAKRRERKISRSGYLRLESHFHSDARARIWPLGSDWKLSRAEKHQLREEKNQENPLRLGSSCTIRLWSLWVVGKSAWRLVDGPLIENSGSLSNRLNEEFNSDANLPRNLTILEAEYRI